MVKHAWLIFLAGCGVEVVELAPRGDVLVIGDVPRDAIARFAGADDTPGMPDQKLLREPAEGTTLPANIAPIRFSWDGKMASYELLLESDARSLRIYTRDASVTVPADRWSALVSEGELRVQLRSLEMMGKGMLRRAERTITIGPALDGTLFFATTSDASQARISDLSAQPAELTRAQGTSRIAQLGPGQLAVDGRMLQVPAGGRIAHPSWSPDGSAILFTYWPSESAGDEGSQLAQLTLDGAFLALPVQGADNPRRPRSDGTRVLFEAGKLDDPELYVVAADGGMARKLMCDGKARAPAWLAGGWLGFIATRDPAHAQIWLASLDEVRCTAPVWFPAQDAQRDYEVMSFERE